jgi:Ca-activated chloride channel homolog
MSRYLCIVGLVVALATMHVMQEQILLVDVDLVNIYLTVHNRKGKVVANLGRESFRVFEDGIAQAITNFSREVDVPLTVVLLMDTSGSVRDKLRFEQQAATGFLYAALRRGRDKAAVMTFDSGVELHQDYTDDPALLANAVRGTIAGGGTRLYDAIYFVITEKLAGDEQRKVMIVITDGDDKSSVHSAEEVAELAQRHDVSIFAISMNALGSRPNGTGECDKILESLSAETGGMALFPVKLETLPAEFTLIGDALRSQYTLAYKSTNPRRDGSFRKIRIETNNTHHAVRTRSGYYAPNEAVARGRN